MKKTVMALLAVATIGTAVLGAACKDDGSGGGVKGATVTEAQFEQAIQTLVGADKLGLDIAYAYSPSMSGAPVSTVMKWDGDTVYRKETYGISDWNEEGYYLLNDTALTMTRYLCVEETWTKEERTLSAEDYQDYKEEASIAENFGLTTEAYRTSADGEDLYLTDMYSVFTYDETKKAYCATVYVPSDEDDQGNLVYSPSSWELNFTDGKLTKVLTVFTMGEGAQSMTTTTTMTISYDVTLTIPQEALNAAEAD